MFFTSSNFDFVVCLFHVRNQRAILFTVCMRPISVEHAFSWKKIRRRRRRSLLSLSVNAIICFDLSRCSGKFNVIYDYFDKTKQTCFDETVQKTHFSAITSFLRKISILSLSLFFKMCPVCFKASIWEESFFATHGNCISYKIPKCINIWNISHTISHQIVRQIFSR